MPSDVLLEDQMPSDVLTGGELSAALSNLVVRSLADVSGRGPTRARATLSENAYFIVLEHTLTLGERNLADHGDAGIVLEMRRGWQRIVGDDLSRRVEEISGRSVIGFMSANHIDPDLAVEVFILAPVAE